jgi:hypothetical protein
MFIIQKISKQEADRVKDEADTAEEFLTAPRFKFLRDYLNSVKEYAQKTILENNIHEVREINTISDRLSKIFIVPKKEQIDELSGQYKLINKIFADLNRFMEMKRELNEALEKKKVKIDD